MVHSGLSEQEVMTLQKQYGANILPHKESFSRLSILLSQFQSPLIYLLLIVGVISLFFHEFIDAALLGAVVLLNVFMGYFQEWSSQKTLASLRNILTPSTLVVRDGIRKTVLLQEIVPKDIVILTAGDKVPADGILLESTHLLVDESLLTGESKAIEMTANPQKPQPLYMGTTVLSGKGIMQITTIGIQTEMGKIGRSLSEIKEEKTPLQEKLEVFSKQLIQIIIVVCTLLFIVELMYRVPVWEALEQALILSVAAVPEGLPIAVTVILALGMKKILKKRGLVKKLLSIETLGSTSVICTDKTGTLTEGKMKVVQTDFTDEIQAQLAMILTNEQRDSLEVALWDFVKTQGALHPEHILNSTEKIYEEPFDSTKKYSLSIVRMGEKTSSFALGAPEIILNFCTMEKEKKEAILSEIEIFAEQGLKVLGMAQKETGELKEYTEYTWLGLCGIEDPLRNGAKETMEQAFHAGILVKIITGDYRKTAEAIAQQLGFSITPANSIEGTTLDTMSDKELSERIKNLLVFSRVTPHQKLRIVEALQKNDEIVAMTGDGVNDAPALKRADIGVVVGSATEVAKEAGDLILLDGNFQTIVAAIEEGRRIFANIKKVVAYVLSNSFVEIAIIFGAVIFDLPTPLTIVQILWIHLICDGPPDIALGFEPKEADVMEQRPQTIKNESILPLKMKLLIFTISIVIASIALMIFSYFVSTSTLALAQTIVFASVAAIDLLYIFSFKNLHRPVFRTEKFFKNKILFLSVLYGFVLIISAVYIPFLNQILGTVPLEPVHWLIVLGVGLFSTALVEAFKLL